MSELYSTLSDSFDNSQIQKYQNPLGLLPNFYVKFIKLIKKQSWKMATNMTIVKHYPNIVKLSICLLVKHQSLAPLLSRAPKNSQNIHLQTHQSSKWGILVKNARQSSLWYLREYNVDSHKHHRQRQSDKVKRAKLGSFGAEHAENTQYKVGRFCADIAQINNSNFN